MRDKPSIVVNTGPLLALVAATGDLEILRRLYDRVVVPFEVASELEASDARPFGADVLARSAWLTRRPDPVTIPAHGGDNPRQQRVSWARTSAAASSASRPAS